MKFNTKRVISGFLAALTIATSAIQPLPVLAADNGSEKPPSYESVKDLLDADEVVTAKDLEIEMGCFLASNFPHFHRYDSLKSALYIHAVSKNINTFPKNQGRIRAAIAVEILDFTVMYR